MLQGVSGKGQSRCWGILSAVPNSSAPRLPAFLGADVTCVDTWMNVDWEALLQGSQEIVQGAVVILDLPLGIHVEERV